MSKEILTGILDEAQKKNRYTWSLHFFKIDRRAKQQPYRVYKVRFKNDRYLTTYVENLLNASRKFQVDKISQVQEYDGENTKVSCDKLKTSNPLIAEQWTAFVSAVGNSSDSKIEGKVNGYILLGEPSDQGEKAVTFVKLANPVTNLQNKRTAVFTTTADDELDLIESDVCRLYLTADFIVYDDTMYTFNHTFETMFDLEKTMAKVKVAAIDKIVGTETISNIEEFKTYATQYKSSRTFITLKDDRIDRIKDGRKRKKVATMLNLSLDANGNFQINTPEEASLLIRYLCYKVFQDSETDDILEASTITKLDISRNP